MREIPVLFKTKLVVDILEGRKTATRRVLKNKHLDYLCDWDANDKNYGPFFEDEYGNHRKTSEINPHGQPGDVLWVRETFKHFGNSWKHPGNPKLKSNKVKALVKYKADGEVRECGEWGTFEDAPEQKWWDTGKSHWSPSIFMPKWACRLRLEVTDVRVERLQDITTEQIIAEGLSTKFREHEACCHLEEKFIELWDSINGKTYPWESNPWVFVTEFKAIK